MNTTAEITLTQGQQEALDAIHSFLMDPNEVAFVLSGYSGCGKSTLIRTFLDRLPDYQKAIKLLLPSFKEYAITLTATTNKAAENLYRISGQPAGTIHSALGLMVKTDYTTGKTQLSVRKGKYDDPLTRHILVVDEASFSDGDLLQKIFQLTKDCKIIFVGDPAQLLQVNCNKAPVFHSKFPTAELTEVVRQAKDNPIIDLATQFRHTVNTGEWPQFTPDNHHVQHMSRDDFMKAVEQEFTRPDWKYLDSKILAWTNKTVIGYNHFINSITKGDPHFQVGDYAICNSFVSRGSKCSIKTDQLVEITNISPNEEHLGVTGNWFEINNDGKFFMPHSLADKNAALKHYRANSDIDPAFEIEQEWIDLRGAFAQTVNKAQGSTYGKVFIDLDDIGRCNNGDTLARMLYVAVSRASDFVYLTGDIS